MVSQHNYYSQRLCKQLIRERVWVEHLQIGMYVAELDRPWLGTPFLLQGFLITDMNDIVLLREHCQYVLIDVAKTKLSAAKIQHAISAKRERTKPSQLDFSVPVEKELAQASITFARAKRTLDNALKAFSTSKEVDMPDIKTTVKGCVKSIKNNSNAMIWLSQIKNKDDYTAEHSLRVAMMAMALGHAVGLKESALEELGIAAMLHDVGKIEVPKHILNKEGALNDAEYEVMKKHADYGREMLLAQPGVPVVAAEVAYSHHEHVAGGGYPRGVFSNKIHLYARIVSVVDAYDAITSERIYSGARSALEGLGILYECRDRQFDKDLVQAFIRMIGVYPPGNIVELNDGSVAIVLASSQESKLKPKIMLVRNTHKKLCQSKIIDLNDQGECNELSIKKVLAEGDYGVRLSNYRDTWGINADFPLSA